MKISEIRDLLDAEVLCGADQLDREVTSACCSDMMSDVLAYVKDQGVLLTGLVNAQVIRLCGDSWRTLTTLNALTGAPGAAYLSTVRLRDHVPQS